MGMNKGGQKKATKARAGTKPVQRKPAQPKAKTVSFQWMSTEANTVAVVGDFNNWDVQAHPLKKGKDGVWKVTLRLRPGTYEYLFVVNSEWREDPLNPHRVPNPHGGFNSLCEVA